MKKFDDFRTEAIRHDRYQRVHGRKAKGRGAWMFTTKRMGEPDYETEVVEVYGNMPLQQAAAIAMERFGTKDVYVMESKEDLSEKKQLPNKLRLEGAKAEISASKWAKEIARIDPGLGKQADDLYFDFAEERMTIQLGAEKIINEKK